MRAGTTSSGFRYQLLDPAQSPPLAVIVAEAAGLGLARFQVCENARPLSCPRGGWEAMLDRAAAAGIEIGLGAKTLDIGVFRRYVELAASVPNRTLRLVLEEDGGAPPTRAGVEEFLRAAVPLVETAGLRLAVENHFDVPSKILAEVAAGYPADLLGFCVDTANSLRSFESPETVLDLLGGHRDLKLLAVDATDVRARVLAVEVRERDVAGQRDRDAARGELGRVAQQEVGVALLVGDGDDVQRTQGRQRFV